jgi:hypothetical protein
MPEVRPDRRKRASQPDKEVGKRRRLRVAKHIQTLVPPMTPKSRVIRGAPRMNWAGPISWCVATVQSAAIGFSCIAPSALLVA